VLAAILRDAAQDARLLRMTEEIVARFRGQGVKRVVRAAIRSLRAKRSNPVPRVKKWIASSLRSSQ
jgi:hypothetical protein